MIHRQTVQHRFGLIVITLDQRGAVHLAGGYIAKVVHMVGSTALGAHAATAETLYQHLISHSQIHHSVDLGNAGQRFGRFHRGGEPSRM